MRQVGDRAFSTGPLGDIVIDPNSRSPSAIERRVPSVAIRLGMCFWKAAVGFQKSTIESFEPKVLENVWPS